MFSVVASATLILFAARALAQSRAQQHATLDWQQHLAAQQRAETQAKEAEEHHEIDEQLAAQRAEQAAQREEQRLKNAWDGTAGVDVHAHKGIGAGWDEIDFIVLSHRESKDVFILGSLEDILSGPTNVCPIGWRASAHRRAGLEGDFQRTGKQSLRFIRTPLRTLQVSACWSDCPSLNVIITHPTLGAASLPATPGSPCKEKSHFSCFWQLSARTGK